MEVFIGKYFDNVSGEQVVNPLKITGLENQLEFMAGKELVFPLGPTMKRHWKEVNELYADYWTRGRKWAPDELSITPDTEDKNAKKRVVFPPLNEYSRGKDKRGNRINLAPVKGLRI